ncbi:hypothetical protein LJY25_13290 [Hymenobacter sp. BT175]|uniref:hypothetical protein n=1 Tax=Hymenobacter translucens TaxID=2886507 RepID=UPI001D0EAD12|nr:hypothetical protein [Hymenobacter translucens]MCC2547424.1 hypothetical protein [Hymenobacter translucens]
MTTPNYLRGFAAALLLLGSAHLLAGCGPDSGAGDPLIPYVSFNEQINLSNQQYSALRADNGAAYTNGGVKGLIIVRQNSSSYLAFERNCPYQPYDACARVRIDPSRLFLADTCCRSQFSLLGQPQGGPAFRPLRQYATNLSGNILTITN